LAVQKHCPDYSDKSIIRSSRPEGLRGFESNTLAMHLTLVSWASTSCLC
jgi:hypothetical protein